MGGERSVTLALAFGRTQNMGFRKIANEQLRDVLKGGGGFVLNGPRATPAALLNGRGLMIMVMACTAEERGQILRWLQSKPQGSKWLELPAKPNGDVACRAWMAGVRRGSNAPVGAEQPLSNCIGR